MLYITGIKRIGSALAEALVMESGSDVSLEEAVGAASGMSRLHDETFDVILVGHDAGDLNALNVVDGLRGTGAEDPIVVLGEPPESDLASDCFSAGADAYLCVGTSTAQNLIWEIQRAIERANLVRENRRLTDAEQQRLAHEQQEADRLLGHQRALLTDLSATSAACDKSVAAVPEGLTNHYRDLLRAYVIMGSGNLTGEIGGLASLLAANGFTSRQIMEMHLAVLEEMVRTLGSRSVRHVIARADLLALEVMVHLAEGYRSQVPRQAAPSSRLPRASFVDTKGTLVDSH
ncbi:MAG: hypothetical protein K8T25_04485 [Planctomycetia bacterium]|nr:hypothetical protein [Planctomycetia bacterium]